MLWAEMSQFVAEYWHEVDVNGGARAHELFLPDGRFSTSVRTYVGQDAIKGFYGGRQARGDRTARHLVSNLRLGRVAGAEVEVHWILSLHAEDGLPVLLSAPPIMIADVEDLCVQTPSGWRLRSRRIVPVFKGGAPTTG
jgi:hypothetical protein